MFTEDGTRDDLGIGQIRDALSEMLFPGTSVTQTRARYFLFVPWQFAIAGKYGAAGQALLDKLDKEERRLIGAMQNAPRNDGLIGKVAGVRVRTLPSTIYWSGLARLGVLVAPMTRQAASRFVGGAATEDGDPVRLAGAWHPTIPPLPGGFPSGEFGGFDLTGDEASWLAERIHLAAAATLFAHLVAGPDLADGISAPWTEPSSLDASAEVAGVLEQARCFSLLIHGASLLYNVVVADAYMAAGFTTQAEATETFRDALTDWAAEIAGGGLEGWKLATLWETLAGAGSAIHPASRAFVESWAQAVATSGGDGLAEDERLRALVQRRAVTLRGTKTVLRNEKLLAQWSGASGSQRLLYRWNTVRRLINDIHEGRGRAGS